MDTFIRLCAAHPPRIIYTSADDYYAADAWHSVVVPCTMDDRAQKLAELKKRFPAGTTYATYLADHADGTLRLNALFCAAPHKEIPADYALTAHTITSRGEFAELIGRLFSFNPHATVR